MKNLLLTVFLTFAIFSLVYADINGVWRARGYYSLEDEMYPERCEHFLSIKNQKQIKWLEIIELVHKVDGNILVSSELESGELFGQFPLGNGFSFSLDEVDYYIEVIGPDHIWLVLPKYKIKFERIKNSPKENLTKEGILLELLNKPFEYVREEDDSVHGNLFKTDSLFLFQHSYDLQHEGVWELIEFEGYFIINKQVSAPFIVDKIEGDRVVGTELDFRYEPRSAMFNLTSIFFRKED